jgi:ABC-type multidrug transport system fused ATPase/permease subunit
MPDRASEPAAAPDTGRHDAATRALDALAEILQPDEAVRHAPTLPSSQGLDESVAWPVTRAAIAAWFGAGALDAAVMVDGLAGLVASRTGEGGSVADADAWVRAELEAGRRPSLFARVAMAVGEPVDRAVDDRMALSFVAWLLEQFRSAGLQTFLQAYDPARRDTASMEAFHTPLGALEERWVAGLARSGSGLSSTSGFISALRPLLRPFVWREAELFVWMIVGAVLGVAVPFTMKILIDDVLPSGSVNLLLAFVVALLGIYALDNAVSVRRNYVASLIDVKVRVALQGRLFERLQLLPHGYYAHADTGDLITRMTADLTQVTGAVSGVLTQGIFSAISAVVAAIALLALEPLLGFLVLLVVPVFAVVFVLMRSRFETVSLAYQNAQGEAVNVIQEQLAAQAVVKAFSLAERTAAAFRTRLETVYQTYMRLVLVGATFEASLDLGVSTARVLVIGAGGYLALQGSMTVGSLLAFIGVMPSLFSPVAAVAGVGQAVQRASGSLERVMEILNAPITISDAPHGVTLPRPADAITFDDITFGYDPASPILRGLALTIPVGSSVAVVGASGGGKSTLVNLLLRFYDPNSGAVRIDGVDLRDATLASVRGAIGMVFQDTFIFDTTIRENIAIGRPGASDADIEAAARAARLEDYIKALPAGLDTVMGERGFRMSGGQRQRLAIARALLRDPAILVLDEATSSLDAITEAEIQAVLMEAGRGRTTIAITHRLTSVSGADQIVVIEDGRIVETGHFQVLVRAGGPFQRLYDEQVAAADAANVEDAARLPGPGVRP